MQKVIVVLSVILGILFIIMAGVYFVTPANHLPHFFPGYAMELTKIHRTHGIGALVVGLLLFAFAWFQSGKKSAKK